MTSGPNSGDAHLAEVFTFAAALPAPRSRRDRELRQQLDSGDDDSAARAALALGVVYVSSHPRVAEPLLRRAGQGPALTAARALLRLAWMCAQDARFADEQRAPEARSLLDQAQTHTREWRSIDGEIDTELTAVRIDIAASQALLGSLKPALDILVKIDQRLRELGDPPEQEEIRRLLAIANLRLGDILGKGDARRAEHHLKRAAQFGADEVRAEACLELGKLLQHYTHGRAHDVEKQYRLAISDSAPGIAAQAYIELGDHLWESGQHAKARLEWDNAAVLGNDELVRRVVRRRRGQWQRERQALAVEARRQEMDFARPLPDVVPRTSLGRIASGRAADAPLDSRRPRRVLVVGAGTGGHYLLPTLRHGYDVCGFVDDAPAVRSVDGITVLGPIDGLGGILSRQPEIEQVIFAIPSAPGVTRLHVLEAADRCDREVVTLPSMFDLRHDHPLQPQLRPFEVYETFGDRPWLVDWSAHRGVLGRRVAILGATSTIGAELARRVADGGPRHLALIDEPHLPLMRLAAEIRDLRGLVDCDARIVDLADYEALDEALRSLPVKPDVVFFCGGIAHQPEDVLPSRHAVRANVVAVDVITRLADEHRVRELIVASSDRAAHRSSTFDMTRALGEWAALRHTRERPLVASAGGIASGSRSPHSDLRVSVLRTPNLWARDGAVVGQLVEQLRGGGPLHVKATRRRFTPAWEAAQTMLRLLGDDHDGGLFALTAGDDIEIHELADRLLLIHGLRSGRDIRVVTTSRPDTKASLALWGLQESCDDEIVPGAARIEPSGELKRQLEKRMPKVLHGSDAERNEALLPYAAIAIPEPSHKYRAAG